MSKRTNSTVPTCSQRQCAQDRSLNLGLKVCLCVEVEGRESHFTTGKEARIADDPEHTGGSVLHLALLGKAVLGDLSGPAL